MTQYITMTLPAVWRAYLTDGSTIGMRPDQIEAAYKWREANADLGACTSVDPDPWFVNYYLHPDGHTEGAWVTTYRFELMEDEVPKAGWRLAAAYAALFVIGIALLTFLGKLLQDTWRLAP